MAQFFKLTSLPLSDFLSSRHQLYFPFWPVLLQGEMGGALPAEPEVFHVVFCGGKSKEPAALKTQQRPGAFRIGALGDHSFRHQVSRVLFPATGQDPRANLLIVETLDRLGKVARHRPAQNQKTKECSSKNEGSRLSRKNYHFPQLCSEVASAFQAVAMEQCLPSLT